MADVNPYALLATSQYTPRNTTLVDQISETKRVTESIMRANPLYNARVDGGLMVWRGNYAGSGGIQDSLLWIGDFGPKDAVLNKLQRGFALTRDDPNHGWAFYMYDPGAESRGAGNPLRQRIFMQDADGKQILSESPTGGVAFPFGVIPLYGTAFNYYQVRVDAGATLKNLPVLPAYIVRSTTLGTYYEGGGPMTGPKLRIRGFGSSVGGSFQARARIQWGDGTTDTTTSFIVCAAAGQQSFSWDIDMSGQDKVGKTPHVRIEAQMVSGSDEWCFLFFSDCYSYG